ncbi:MAG: bifunctional DNA-formamidopyrimidine glycosylase/DNA-(apurinic or apyrimidinic site) lyase [Coriobacteriales bacterium]|jgi:formamidopyrimidine-DNA glycosylase|nr:bifunctional DNA-formamidopyrimidine glycosylase/DNA-(apurinic or apyrimidinic site) lyase [Coriobacteriales bacterium]
MPELPEAEVIRRGLNSVLPGKVISSVVLSEPRSFVGSDDELHNDLMGLCVVCVERRGKMLLVRLVSNERVKVATPKPCEAASVTALEAPPQVAGVEADLVLLIHLRMTGQLVYRIPDQADDPALSGGYPSASLIGELPDKSTRVIIGFCDGSKLYFNDQRKFGYMKLIAASSLVDDDFLSRLGPEPLEPDFTWQDLRTALLGKAGKLSTTTIKAALLDQEKLAGIGNIYADESLFRAGIDPRRSVSSLKPKDYQHLLVGIRECLMQSIAAGGSTARNYVDALGLRGEFLDLHAAVYGRTGKPCPNCGRPIVKIRVAGRGTHLCEKCQR